MSDNDLIRRGDALAVVANGKTTWGEAVTAIAALPAVTVGVKDFDVEVVRGNTGGNLALYFNDHRVAGSKPWGGGTTIHKFRAQGDDAKSAGILATIRDFQTVPPVKECLTTDTALPAVTQPAPDAAAIREAALVLLSSPEALSTMTDELLRGANVNTPTREDAACVEQCLREALALITEKPHDR